MRITKGSLFSVSFHIAVAFFVAAELPHLWQRKLPQESAVSVEILPISQMTNMPTKTQTTKEKPKIKGQVKKSSPKKMENNMTVKSEPLDAVPIPVPKPDAKEKLKKASMKGEDKASHIEPVLKPRIEEKRKVKIDEDFDSLLKNLETSYEKPEEKPELHKVKATQTTKPFNPEHKLTMTEEDALRSQIAKCWNVPVGARDADKTAVLLRISMQKDGTVVNVKMVDSSKYHAQTFYRAIADSAIRAVYRCSPFKLPREKFDFWRELELNFDLRDMVY